mmetsp:Transcript_8533/g.17660  ORF Transcript_8533/g.17660 Transcript_8533/m.17660 type:complete len:567 (-) Transcript_8533:61-1761(-)
MAKGKSSRSKPSQRTNHARHQVTEHAKKKCLCANCVSLSKSPSPQSHPSALGHKCHQDVMDAIEYHWKILSLEVKFFLLEDPMQLCLQKLVNFWCAPQRKETSLSGQVAASIMGSSYFLALNYTFIDKTVEARALILNGAFLRQCIATPVEEIEKLSRDSSNMDVEVLKTKMPIYCAGLVAASTSRKAMDRFLNDTLPPDYRRRMTFASQTANAKNPVGDYVNLISSDWNSRSTSYSRRKSLDATTNGGAHDAQIKIILVDAHSMEETTVQVSSSTMLKTIFSNYAEENKTSVRSLRFSYCRRTLFLTEVGSKSLSDYEMSNLDKITITNMKKPKPKAHEPTAEKNVPNFPNGIAPSKKPCMPKKKFKRTNSMPEVDDSDKFKISHSRTLTRLFEEAEPKFKELRQKLNTLNLQNTQPKQKTYGRRHSVASVRPVINNPPTEGVGGKAGKVCHFIQVGAVENLYKTTKPLVYAQRRNSNPCAPDPIQIDLHGLTREQALEELDANLPLWVDAAMRGAYPWVLPVTVVCGGGSQILSEAVEKWVKSNGNVSNAPKMIQRGSRRASIQ